MAGSSKPPDFELRLSGSRPGQSLTLGATAGCDTVLLVNDARGQWHFDDDSGGSLNPSITIPNMADGTYDIWVGTYSRGNCAATLTLRSSALPAPPPPPSPPVSACPNPGLSGQQLVYSAGALTGGQSAGVTAGGNLDLRNCGSVPGHGWIIASPDFELQLSGAAPGQSLTLGATAGCDTVLLVNDARGQWHFDDDSGGSLNPSITIPNIANGTYDIWVGTYSPGNGPATLALRSSALPAPPPPPSPPVSACPNPGLSGAQLVYGMASLLGAGQSTGVTAGGNIDLRSCGSVPGHGWITVAPDFELRLSGAIPG